MKNREKANHQNVPMEKIGTAVNNKPPTRAAGFFRVHAAMPPKLTHQEPKP